MWRNSVGNVPSPILYIRGGRNSPLFKNITTLREWVVRLSNDFGDSNSIDFDVEVG